MFTYDTFELVREDLLSSKFVSLLVSRIIFRPPMLERRLLLARVGDETSDLFRWNCCKEARGLYGGEELRMIEVVFLGIGYA